MQASMCVNMRSDHVFRPRATDDGFTDKQLAMPHRLAPMDMLTICTLISQLCRYATRIESSGSAEPVACRRAYIVMTYVVMAYIVMACSAEPVASRRTYIFMACTVMAYIAAE